MYMYTITAIKYDACGVYCDCMYMYTHYCYRIMQILI
jgi:hypothetical protein